MPAPEFGRDGVRRLPLADQPPQLPRRTEIFASSSFSIMPACHWTRRPVLSSRLDRNHRRENIPPSKTQPCPRARPELDRDSECRFPI